MPDPSPTPAAAPSRTARALALAAIVAAGACGGLIGFAVTDLSCDGGCAVAAGLVGLAGAVAAALGVAVVAVLALRAMSEWQAVRTARRIGETEPGRRRPGPA